MKDKLLNVLLLLFVFAFFAETINAKPLNQVRWEPLPNTVSLTFDDGPNPIDTPKILKILKKYNIKATFFVMGSSAEKYPELIKEMVKDGHAVGVHSMSHPKLTSLDNKQLYYEVVKPKEIVKSIIGKAPVCLRPPFGISNAKVRAFIREQDMIPVPLGFNSYDYNNPGVTKLTNWVVSNAKAGTVILLHDGYEQREQTVKALPGIIEGIQKKGLGFSAICYP